MTQIFYFQGGYDTMADVQYTVDFNVNTEEMSKEFEEATQDIMKMLRETLENVPVSVDTDSLEKSLEKAENLVKKTPIEIPVDIKPISAKDFKDKYAGKTPDEIFGEAENERVRAYQKKLSEELANDGNLAFDESWVDRTIAAMDEVMQKIKEEKLGIIDVNEEAAKIANEMERQAKMAEGLREAYASAFGAQAARDTLKQAEEQKNASKAADEYAKRQKASSDKAKKSIEEVINSAKKLVQALNKIGKAAVSLGKSAVRLGFGTLKGMLHTLTLGLGGARKEATLLSQALKLIGIAGLGALFKKANESATELTKNMNIVNEQFGESAAGLHKWAEQSAWAFNVSRTEAEKYFGELGDFLSNVGVEAEQSAVMVKNMVGYSGLIATRKGLKTEDVEKVFAKVIEGSTKGTAYKATLGIDLNDKAINSALKSMNIEATYSELNEADKATARWLTTMYQLSDQFDLTASSLGNFEGKISTWDGAIETITSNAKDALADLGLIMQHYLLPIIQVLARIVSALANSLRNLVGALGLDIPEAPALEDTADGVGKLGDEYEETGKKAKKAGLGLASFDKLNNLSSGSSSDGLSGASSKLKDAVGLFDKIPDVSKQRKTLQEMLDSLMNKDWNLAGQNFGKWVNNIVNSARSLIKRLKKYNLGKKLASWVNGVFKGIDWKNAGELFGGLWDLIFDNIEGFLRDLNTKDVGTAIKDFLNGFNIKDKLGDIGTNFGLAIQDLSEIIKSVFDGEDGQKLLTDIKDGFSSMITNALEEINPSDLADGASYIVKAVLSAIQGIFNNANAKKLGKFTSTFTKEMASNGVYKDIGETFAGVITSAITYAGSVLGDGHTVVDLVNGLFEGIKNAFSDPSFDFSESMKGIAKGIGEGLSSLGKQISDSSSGINVELNDFFSSDEFKTFAKGLADFLVSALTFACDTVVTQLPTILKTLFDAVVKKITEDPWGVTKAIAALFAWSKFVSVGGLKGIVTFAGKFAKTLASKIKNHPQIAALLFLISTLWQGQLDEMYNEAKDKSIKQVQAFWEGVADGTEKGSAQVDVLKNNKKSALEEFNTYMLKTSGEIQELEAQIYNPQGSTAEEKVKNRNAAIEAIKEKYQTLIDKMKAVGLATDDVEIALAEFEETAKTKLHAGLSETDQEVSNTIIALNNLTLAGGQMQLDWDATYTEMSKQPGIVGQAVDELGTKTGEVLPSVEEKMSGILTSANDSALSMGLLSGQADSAAEKFEGLVQTNNRVMKALDQQKKKTELSEKALQKQKEETERLKTENGYLSNAIELLSKTDLPTFKTKIEELNTPLDHFLDSLSKIHTSDFGMGKITDTVALQKNMDEAFRIVDEASKKIDGAIAAASNLRNFEATLSSTQTIKVDSSGTMNFKFDVTTKPDKDAFNSWQEKYTKANKALNGG